MRMILFVQHLKTVLHFFELFSSFLHPLHVLRAMRFAVSDYLDTPAEFYPPSNGQASLSQDTMYFVGFSLCPLAFVRSFNPAPISGRHTTALLFR